MDVAAPRSPKFGGAGRQKVLPKNSGETENGRIGCWTFFGGSGSYNGFFEATSAWKHLRAPPLWRHPALSLWALEGDTYQVSIDLCQYEAPEPNKVYMAQTVELLATHEAFKELARRCPGNHPHMDFGRDFTSRARTWHATAFATAVVQVVDKVKTNPYVAFVTGDSPGGELAQPASDDGADDVEGAQAITLRGA